MSALLKAFHSVISCLIFTLGKAVKRVNLVHADNVLAAIYMGVRSKFLKGPANTTSMSLYIRNVVTRFQLMVPVVYVERTEPRHFFNFRSLN